MKIIYKENYEQQIKQIIDYNRYAREFNDVVKARTRPITIIDNILFFLIVIILAVKGLFFIEVIHKILPGYESYVLEWLISIIIYLGLCYVFICVHNYGFQMIIDKIFGKKKEPMKYTDQQRLYEELVPLGDKLVNISFGDYSNKLSYEYVDDDGNILEKYIIIEGIKVIKNISVEAEEIDLDELMIKIPASIHARRIWEERQ